MDTRHEGSIGLQSKFRPDRVKGAREQRGVAAILIVLLIGVALAASVLGLLAYTRSAQTQQLPVHTLTQTQSRAWSGVEMVRRYLTHLSSTALAALEANTTLSIDGLTGVSATVESNTVVTLSDSSSSTSSTGTSDDSSSDSSSSTTTAYRIVVAVSGSGANSSSTVEVVYAVTPISTTTSSSSSSDSSTSSSSGDASAGTSGTTTSSSQTTTSTGLISGSGSSSASGSSSDSSDSQTVLATSAVMWSRYK